MGAPPERARASHGDDQEPRKRVRALPSTDDGPSRGPVNDQAERYASLTGPRRVQEHASYGESPPKWSAGEQVRHAGRAVAQSAVSRKAAAEPAPGSRPRRRVQAHRRPSAFGYLIDVDGVDNHRLSSAGAMGGDPAASRTVATRSASPSPGQMCAADAAGVRRRGHVTKLGAPGFVTQKTRRKRPLSPLSPLTPEWAKPKQAADQRKHRAEGYPQPQSVHAALTCRVRRLTSLSDTDGSSGTDCE
jgi:hypothetical protein